MDLLECHASRETPVTFPGWRGYPPTYNDSGDKIDYSLSSNGGAFAEKKLTETRIVQHGRRVQTPHTAGNTTWHNKIKDRKYQTELRHINPDEYSSDTHGIYKVSRTRPQHLGAFGFRQFE